MPESPLVGILIGSESDRERMQPAVDELAARGIACELEVRSAHRQPDAVAEYARSARERGLRVLIAGAGLAAYAIGFVAYVGKLAAGGFLLAVFETSIAKMRVFRVPQFLGAALMLGLLAALLRFVSGGL